MVPPTGPDRRWAVLAVGALRRGYRRRADSGAPMLRPPVAVRRRFAGGGPYGGVPLAARTPAGRLRRVRRLAGGGGAYGGWSRVARRVDGGGSSVGWSRRRRVARSCPSGCRCRHSPSCRTLPAAVNLFTAVVWTGHLGLAGPGGPILTAAFSYPSSNARDPRRLTMARLAQTPGLTDVQRVDPGDRAGVRRQGDHPARAAAGARRRVPGRHRRRHARDGPVRPDHRRGVRRARRVAADLRAGGRGAVPGLDVDLRHRQHPLHRRVPDRPARLAPSRRRGCCRGWPPARCAARSRCPSPDCGSDVAGDPDPGPSATATATSSTDRRCG